MSDRGNRVCPVERAGDLDSRIRRWFQNPQKILRPYIKEGMTVLEVGCGPGFFTVDAALLAGKSGQVIACDLQEGMLEKVSDKITGTELETRIRLHKCTESKLGVSGHVDFVLLFYVVHEIPDKEGFFDEIRSILKPNGQVLLVEPPFHVSKQAFEETIKTAGGVGFVDADGPNMLFHKTVILKKG